MKSLLVVIDMQNDFITGALGNSECLCIVDKVLERIDRARRDSGEDIVYTLDTHGADYSATQEGVKLPVPHCVKGTDGWRLIPELRDSLNGYRCFEKNTFGSVDLGKYVAEHHYDYVELAGVCTDICVISNSMVIKAFCPETRIAVNKSCCAGVTPERHETAIRAMASCQVEIIE